ncbi:hypothetical protein PUN4_190026 [Paraburkholderia unamae]|nr:hypothetical protein PUN4_190026 [Paraburkholderia unamae]
MRLPPVLITHRCRLLPSAIECLEIRSPDHLFSITL